MINTKFNLKEVLKISDRKNKSVYDLQTNLKKLGFDPGESDGYYGYLTREAVKELQLSYGLRVDGIAGNQVFGLLSEKPIGCRNTVVGKRGASIKKIADENLTTVDALVAANGNKNCAAFFCENRLKVYKRMLINIPDTKLYRNCSNEEVRLESNKSENNICKCTMTTKTIFRISNEGEIKKTEYSEHSTNNFDVMAVISTRKDDSLFSTSPLSEGMMIFLKNFFKKSDEVLKYIFKTVKEIKAKAILIDIAEINPYYNGKFIKFFACLKKECLKENILCGLTIDFKCYQKNIFPYDIFTLSKMSDFILMQYEPIEKSLSCSKKLSCVEEKNMNLQYQINRPLGKEDFRSWLSLLCSQIPRWKLIITMFVGCFKLEDEKMYYMTHNEVTSLQSRYFLKESKDATSKYDFYRYKDNGKWEKIWKESKESLSDKLYFINRYNVLGVALLGYEGREKNIISEIEKKFIII